MWNMISTLRKKSDFGWDENLRMITCEMNVYDKEVIVCELFLFIIKFILVLIFYFYFFEIVLFLLIGTS